MLLRAQTIGETEQPENSGTVAASPFQALSADDQWRRYRSSCMDLRSIVAAAAGAGLGQAMDTVPEWEQGGKGYARRFGSAYGKHLVATTLSFGVGGLMGYDPRYFPSQSTRYGGRIADSIKQTIVARDNSGKWRTAYHRIIANFGGGFISRFWHPAGERDWKHGLRSGAISFGADAAMNLLKEFARFTR
jgi:hypothetical protein